MRDWCLDPGTWQEIADRLPPRRDRSRRSWTTGNGRKPPPFTWAHVTQGEPRFAPRPIEASQPEAVRKDWAPRRGNLWHKLAYPGRFVHYTELRKLLIEHGDRLARDIDGSTEADDDL